MANFLIVYCVCFSIVCFGLMGYDKWASIYARKHRVPENLLLLLAVFGAWGEGFGMLVFRHKIRKPRFYCIVPLLASMELIVIYICYCVL